MLRIGISQLLEKKSWSEGTPLLRNRVFCVSHWPPISSIYALNEPLLGLILRGYLLITSRICLGWTSNFFLVFQIVCWNKNNFFDTIGSKIWPHIRRYKFSPKKSTFFDQPNDSQIGVTTDPPPSKKISTLYFTPLKLCVKFFWVGGSVLGVISRKRFS